MAFRKSSLLQNKIERVILKKIEKLSVKTFEKKTKKENLENLMAGKNSKGEKNPLGILKLQFAAKYQKKLEEGPVMQYA